MKIVASYFTLAVAFAAGLTPDTAKQVLERSLLKLKPAGISERNVLFQDVRVAGGAGGTYQVLVTILVRDYEPGYPANRYYGNTCVGKFQDEKYTMSPDSFGGWLVDGRLTPPDKQCKPNPSAGVSSIPLQSLSGTAALSGPVAAAPEMARSGGGVAQGSYECWAGRSASMGQNFSIAPGGRYTDASGHPGSFTFDTGTQRIVFQGGALDSSGTREYTTIYYEPHGRPTVSFRNRSGSEVVFCQKR